MTSSSLFEQVANRVLEASEQVTTRFEEGLSILMTGNLPTADNDNTNNDMGNGGGEGQQYGDDFEMFDEEDEEILNMFGGPSPLQGIADSVVGDIMKHSAQPVGFWENIDAFRCAITWSEPFIIGLIIFQICMFLLCLYVSKKPSNYNQDNTVVRFSLLIFIALIVRGAEYINKYLSNNYKNFGIQQNYFDKHGYFISVMFCLPLMMDCIVMLLLFLREASTLLIQVKSMEIKNKQKQKKNKKEKKDN